MKIKPNRKREKRLHTSGKNGIRFATQEAEKTGDSRYNIRTNVALQVDATRFDSQLKRSGAVDVERRSPSTSPQPSPFPYCSADFSHHATADSLPRGASLPFFASPRQHRGRPPALPPSLSSTPTDGIATTTRGTTRNTTSGSD